MKAYQHFYQAFSKESLNRIYNEKLQYHLPVGLDNIIPDVFRDHIDNNIDTIIRKVLKGSYHFTRYREVLISKGKGKPPRVISVPTSRDSLALAAYLAFLQNTFDKDIKEPLLHTIIGDITNALRVSRYNGFVKADIRHFYASIDHRLLLSKVKRRIRKKEAIQFLKSAISTETRSRVHGEANHSIQSTGVPEGLSISNILADIYLADLESRICSIHSNIRFFRFVDDIIILCDADEAEGIKDTLIEVLKREYQLEAHPEKTVAGNLVAGVPYLGYVFYKNRICIRSEAIQKLEYSIEELFRKQYHNKIASYGLFVWKLNLRIVGCILEDKKYGWLFYYSQMDDLTPLYHLDWLIKKFFARYNIKKPDGLKTFVRGYHEITKNVSHSTYLINANFFSSEEKRKVLEDVYPRREFENIPDETIDVWFKQMLFREIKYLEHDIQSFS